MRLATAAAILLLALSTACGGDTNGPSSLANGSFSAKIDGSNFNATAAAVVNTGGIVSIGAGNAAGQTLGFAWVNASNATGTFAVGSGSATVGTHTFQGHTWSASSLQGSGSITVTTLTANHIVGTFSFVLNADAASGATGTRTITAGKFDLTY